MHTFELLEYQLENGRVPIREWIDTVPDNRTRARVDARLLRVRAGNFGDAKSLGGGVYELRIDFGPGYRIYYGMQDQTVVILLVGGTKATQSSDIRRARRYWKDFRTE